MAVVLVIKENEDYHSVLLTNSALILGRSSSCDVRLTDERVSGRHLAIKLSSQGKVMIKDLETTNGSYLNGIKIQESLLMLKDELMIGGVSLTLEQGQLTPKERVILTREDATQLKFIKLNTQTGTKSEQKELKEKVPATPINEPEDDHVSSNEEFKFEVPQSYAQSDSPSSEESFKSSTQERLEAAAKIADKVKAAKNNLKIDEAQFDLGAPSGKTQMIKLQKKEPKESELKKHPKKRKSVEKSEDKPVSILGKLASIFKK